MNLILVAQPSPVIEFSVGDSRFDHARGVLRLRPGDSFYVGVLRGPIGLASVVAVSSELLTASVVWQPEAPRAPYPIDLWIGLSRPQTMKKVLFEAAVWGVKSIQVIHSGKSDPAYARSSLWGNQEYRKVIQEGLEQGFHTWAPEVCLHEDWNSLSEKITGQTTQPENQETKSTKGLRLALDLYEAEGSLGAELRNALLSAYASATIRLAIGPERGWNTADRKALRAANFRLVSLGTPVLRVESAVTAALALAVDSLQSKPESDGA